MTNLVQINNLRDFNKCPNFAKYNWNYITNSVPTVTQKVIQSAYKDLAVLGKKIDWRTIRSRQFEFVSKTSEDIYKSSINNLNTLRPWYINIFRDGPDECLVNLNINYKLYNTDIETNIDGVLIDKNQTILLDFTDKNNINEIIKDIGLRTKILLLDKQNIKIHKVLSINCTETAVSCNNLNIDNISNINYKTEQVLQLMLYSMNNKIYYPSITSMCTTCKYKDICSW